MKKLYVEIIDNETNEEELVVLIPFGEDEDYMRPCVHHDQICMEVLVDEGYSHTYYYYPVPRYSIKSVSAYN